MLVNPRSPRFSIGWQSCGRKRRYASEEGARQAAAACNLSHGYRLGRRVEAYPCRHCGGWHVGHHRRPGRVRPGGA